MVQLVVVWNCGHNTAHQLQKLMRICRIIAGMIYLTYRVPGTWSTEYTDILGEFVLRKKMTCSLFYAYSGLYMFICMCMFSLMNIISGTRYLVQRYWYYQEVLACIYDTDSCVDRQCHKSQVTGAPKPGRILLRMGSANKN